MANKGGHHRENIVVEVEDSHLRYLEDIIVQLVDLAVE